MDEVSLEIDGSLVKVEKGATVLEAAQRANIYIPTLCYHPDLSPFGSCRLCAVEIDGVPGFPSACITPAREGMVVHTNTPLLQEVRRYFLGVILSQHPHICLTCEYREQCEPQQECRKGIPLAERCCPLFPNCELRKVADYIGVPDNLPPYRPRGLPVVTDEPLFIQDHNLCLLCGRCVRACQELRGVGALQFITSDDKLEPRPFAGSLEDSGCRFCGACVEVCPSGALRDKELPREDREATLVPCKAACPAGVDVPRYVNLIAEGKFAEALAIVREKVPFPGTLGRVCPAPCEEACRRKALNEPIAIRALKRFAADRDTGLWRQNSKVRPPTGKRIAIIGSGPAGLTAAYYLTKLGHSVTVYEALPQPGGMLRVGIPEYRLPREILEAEIEGIKEAGVEVRTNTRVESLDELFQQGYSALFLALGAHQGVRLGIEGENSPGVMDCLHFLRDINLGLEVKLGKKVAVVGGGNAAIDSARTALRLGAEEVTILYRRSRAEMPAYSQELERASEEGINFLFLTAPHKIDWQDGMLGLQCQRMLLGEPDASGRRRPIPVKGSEFTLEFDNIILALGQRPSIPEQFGLPLSGDSTIQVNLDTLATARQGVFAGGDVVTGPASVIEAIAAGRRAAASIDRYLGGEGTIEETLAPSEELSPWLGRDGDFAHRHRLPVPTLAVDLRLERFKRRHAVERGWLLAEQPEEVFAERPSERTPWQVPPHRPGDFPEVELGFDQEQAIEEAKRCLKCHLRLNISSVTFPQSK